MSVLREWTLDLDVDHVLRGQGADAERVRQRTPQLLTIAEQALVEGIPLLEPMAAYERLPVRKVLHDRLVLENGVALKGEIVARQLAPAEQVILVVCTIGDRLEQRAAELYADDPMLALALDGLGTVAIDALVAQVCVYFEKAAAADGLETTIPVSPGMIGWPVEQGQPEIFSQLDTSGIGVTLTESCMMVPRKSTSMVIGVGLHAHSEGIPCDFCSVRDVCRYRQREGRLG